jgi:predicted Zn-dependent peptidase
MQKDWQTFVVTDEIIGYHGVLDNGLRVYLVPQTNFEEAHASFLTNYGSAIRRFVNPQTEEWYTAPDGVAHFLEHKLFDQEDGRDVMLAFYALGASANAYTTRQRTAYTFSTNKRVPEAVNLLLDYVQAPYFTAESVEKEKGIIEQEILMYEDNFDWRGYSLALAHAYQAHPVGVDIAGSVESIYQITKEDLYTCYNTFYHPSNMTFILSGNFDLSTIQKTIETNQAGKAYAPQEEIIVEKIVDITHTKAKAVKEDIAAKTNYITILYKDICAQKINKPQQYQELLSEVILDMVFSDLSLYTEAFLEAGLIEEEIGYSSEYEEEYAYITWQVSTKQPNEFIAAFRSALFEGEMMTVEQFEKIRKASLGNIMQIQNSPRMITRFLSDNALTPQTLRAWLQEITYEEVLDKYEQMKAHLDDGLTFVFLAGTMREERGND